MPSLATVWLMLAAVGQIGDATVPSQLTFQQGDRVCLIGNTLAERMQHDGWLETRLQHRFRGRQVVIRNLGFSADEVTIRLRSPGAGNLDDHLTQQQADVILAFFGYNESFADVAGLDAFRQQLDQFVKHTLSRSYNGQSPPRLVLFSPIAHEDLHDHNLPDGTQNNRRLKLYTEAIGDVARLNNVPFVDLFQPTLQAYPSSSRRWTDNGIHLNEFGNRQLARIIDQSLFGGGQAEPASEREPDEPRLARLRAAILDKNLHWFHRYRAVDGYSIYGGRSWLSFVGGQTNRQVMRREMEVLDVMTANRDRRIWSVAEGDDPALDDSNVPAFVEVTTNQPGPGPNGTHLFLGAEQAIGRMRVAEGMQVQLFASEEQFPELANPVQMAFDTRGRLWVAVMPSYPHWKPGEPLDDKVLILDDSDGDGRADRCTVFADGLHVPTGLEFFDQGLLVGAQPDLLYLRDTDGDDRADIHRRVLHGLDSADTHHALNSFVLEPGGALHFQEGTFHHTQVETPWGPPVRNVNAGVFRYEPRTQKLNVHVAYDFVNPHGHAFDRWGQDFVTDATGNLNFFATPISGRVDYPDKHASYFPFFQPRVRPSAASEILSSRHFPPSMQGRYLLANVIGAQGILQYRLEEDGSGFRGIELEPLVLSSDPNFRPVDMEVGPDGAVYFLDWHNPLIGHMQHSIRDPNRDRTHGRVYRLICKDRPLLKPSAISGQPIEELLELLREPEDRVRYRVRIELGGRDSDQVTAAVRQWVNRLDASDPEHPHPLLEALWMHQAHNVVNRELLERLLRSPDFRARAAATRVLCAWRDRVPRPLEVLGQQVRDEHPRVRLEAVRACSFFRQAEAAEVALQALRFPLDRFLSYALAETIQALEADWKPVVVAGRPFAEQHPEAVQYVLGRLPVPELLQMELSRPVCMHLLSREGIPHPRRHAALMQLAGLNDTDMMRESLAALERLDGSDEPQAPAVLADLSHILSGHAAGDHAAVEHATSDPAAHRTQLERLAKAARRPLTRRIAIVTLIMIDGSLDPVWESAADSLARLRDVVDSIALIPDPKIRATAHARLAPLLLKLPSELAKQARAATDGEPALEFRRAVIKAISYTGMARAETIGSLCELSGSPQIRSAVIAALGRMPLRDWPPAQVRTMVDGVIARLAKLPADERTSPDALEELALGNRLANLLPRAEAQKVRESLDDLGVRVIVVRPVPQQLQFDRTRIFVEAGKPVEIVFENVDIMPHNLVITRPGALARVGLAAEGMVGQSDAFDRDFVPDIPDVLLATRLLQPSQSARIAFVAPGEVGEYPFVCTFPGHWRRMYGTVHVVEHLENVPLEAMASVGDSRLPTRPLVRDWTLADLEDDLPEIGRDRSFQRGKALFDAVACARCHRLGGAGGQVGPDLESVKQKLESKQWQPIDVLREIVEPSARMDPKYETRVIQGADGRVHAGIVAKRDATIVQLLTNPLDDGEPLTIRVDQIEEEFSSKVSLMPLGLLNTLDRQEILDLLAYLVSGGDPKHPAFQKD